MTTHCPKCGCGYILRPKDKCFWCGTKKNEEKKDGNNDKQATS